MTVCGQMCHKKCFKKAAKITCLKSPCRVLLWDHSNEKGEELFLPIPQPKMEGSLRVAYSVVDTLAVVMDGRVALLVFG